MQSSEDRAAERAAELEMLLIREAVSLGVMCIVLALMHPKVQLWAAQQKQRLRRRQTARSVYEAKALAELRRELSRDLPLVEHGLVDP